MKKKSTAARFNGLFLFSYAAGAIGTTQTIPYLVSMGFEGVQKGIILSGMAISTLVTQFLFGYLSDKFKGCRWFFLSSFGIFFVGDVVLFGFRWPQFWYLLAMISLTGGIARTWQGLEDTWVLQIDETKPVYSRIHAWGAFGWAIGSWAAAILLNWLDFPVIAVLVFFSSGAALYFAWNQEDAKRASGKVVKLADLKELVKNKAYILLVLILLVLFGMGTADMYIVVDKVMAIGGTSFHVGAKWGLQSLMEIPILLVGDKLMKKYDPANLMLGASVLFGVRFIVYSLIQNPWWMIAAAVFQMVTFPIIIISSKLMIDEIISEKLKSSGQMAAMSVYMGISLLVMPVFCSSLSEAIGCDPALLVVAAFALVAIVLILIFKKVRGPLKKGMQK
ncbi:MFS transporter [Holdemania massiliensis]|uniref:MFS transporter n=1 Tax=Holdemania massiliensis TaxID=1468449 RepID=UPI00267661AA|nr:MFS transporter [Holdemania massiliensis]